MKERRKARVGTVSGLALLAGATAVAAVAGVGHTVFSTGALGMLAVALGHSLLDEVSRQARRESADGWAMQDTINTAMLSGWATVALILTVTAALPVRVRAVAAALFLGYALTCLFFVGLRRRTVASVGAPVRDPHAGPGRAGSERSRTTSSATPTAKTDAVPDGYGMPSR